MNNSKLFWGTLLIGIGLLILFNNLWGIDLGFSSLLKLWPMVFIFWGIYLIVKNSAARSFITVFIGLFLALSIFATFKSFTDFFHNRFDVNVDGPVETYEFVKEYSDSITYASFKFSAGAGTFKLRDTTGSLFHASSESFKDSYEFYTASEDTSALVNLEMKDKVFHIDNGKIRNKVWMALNTHPIWDIEFNTGAAKVDVDLSPYKVEKLNIDVGAAAVKLRLGGLAEISRVDVDAGVSDIEIEIPDNIGCEIMLDDALSSKSLNGFSKIGSGLYRSDNFESAEKKIYIKMDVGLSSLSVNQYASAGW